MELFDYQKEAVDFLLKVKKGYLALDMGMGKTLTALAAAEKAGGNVLVVAEKNEIVNAENFRKETALFPEFAYVNLREQDPPKGDGRYKTRFVCGINPDALVKHSSQELADCFTVMIVDESTMAKNCKTARFKKISAIAREMEYVFLLSGTPMMNGAAELYAPLALLGHRMAREKYSQFSFETVFAGGHYRKVRNTGNFYKDHVFWAKGANHVRVLRMLTEDVFFVRQKKDASVFKNKTRTVARIPMSVQWLAEYRRAFDEYLEKAKKRAVNLDNVKELQALIENGQCYQVNSRWKVNEVIEDIVVQRKYTGRIVVWSLFIETFELLKKYLRANGVQYRTFDELQEWKTGDEKVLLGRIGAHGKGANVPEASTALFVDMSFVPASNIQAENRIDRPEQENDMLIVYYVTDGDDVVDAHVQRINQDKARKIEQFIAPISELERDTLRMEIEQMRKKYPREMSNLNV